MSYPGSQEQVTTKLSLSQKEAHPPFMNKHGSTKKRGYCIGDTEGCMLCWYERKGKFHNRVGMLTLSQFANISGEKQHWCSMMNP